MPRLLLVALLALRVSVYAADPTSTSPGDVRFFRVAGSDFDQFTQSPTAVAQAWMRSSYWRMVGYPPYFDSRLSWSPPAWAYLDLYAIYVGSPLATAHPEWILRDGAGNPLYIPYGCSGTGCPQYAGDVGNPAFRDNWIARAATVLAAGYRGLFVDDVNMLFRVGDGAGQQTAPLDPRTGLAMTDVDWRRYVAEFTEAISRAFPAIEIAHNAIWYAGHDDPSVQRELVSADWINLERGVNDDGLRGGSGRYGLETFFAHVDWLHAAGKSVVFDSKPVTEADHVYGLAAYFLVGGDSDAIGAHVGGTPADWWPGYNVSLGTPLGPRYGWNGLLRRDFTGGTVLVNEPEAATQTVGMGGAYVDLAGAPATSVTLGAATGAVLLGSVGTTTTTSPTTPPSTRPPTTTTSSTVSSTSTTLAAPRPCADVIALPAEGGVFTGMTAGLSGEGGSCGGGAAPERIFAWTPVSSGVATIDTCSPTATDHDTVLYVRDGACEGSEVACNDDTRGCGITTDAGNPHLGSLVTPTVTAGRTYYIVVDGYADRSGAFSLTVMPPAASSTSTTTSTTSTTLPIACPGSIALPSMGGTFQGTTAGNGTNAGSCGGGWAPEQLFEWTPSTSGTATIETCSPTATDHDTVLYVREGGCQGPEAACNDDTRGCGVTADVGNPHLGSRVTLQVIAGTTYAIVVDGYGTQSGGFQLTVTAP